MNRTASMLLEDLIERGYTVIEHPTFVKGQQVRNQAEQYVKAVVYGTARVFAVAEHPSLGVEVIVTRLNGTSSAWQDYRTAVVTSL